MTTKHQATPEQKAARLEKLQALKELTRRISEMTEAEKAAWISRAPVLRADGQPFSPTNQKILAAQLDTVTMCAGFAQWKQLGRSVKKGEHGLACWAPAPKAKDPNKKPGECSASELDMYFFMTTVFDISQTEETQH